MKRYRNPVHKNLAAARLLANAGIDFVPIPALSQEHKQELLALAQDLLTRLGQPAVPEMVRQPGPCDNNPHTRHTGERP